MRIRRVCRLVGLLVLALSAGCASVFGPGSSTETVSAVPVPVENASGETRTGEDSTSETRTGSSTRVATPAGSLATPAAQPRYLSVRPNCRRPPGMVIHIQVVALANNDPQTDEGINTTYQFSNPTPPDGTGPPEIFVERLERSYSPLLNHRRVTYGPLQRSGIVAFRNVTVETSALRTTYNWTVIQRRGGRYDGCWFTTSVVETDENVL
jgi:hypothetical protein